MLVQMKRQSGMSLIEAMIALVVISVGLLGVAALQIVALQQSASSQWHSQAVWSNYEMTDRILANRTQFANYAGIDTSRSYSQNCQNSACTSAQMINADAQDWTTKINSLPGGVGIIAAPSAGVLTVTVMWDDEGTGATGRNCSSNTEIDLTCFGVTIIQ